MERHRAALAAACAAAAVLALGGCGPARGGEPAAPAPGVREPGAAEQRVLARAEQVLIGRCMGERGFAYAVTEPPDPQAEGARSFPYGIDDVAWARAHGYGGAEERRAEQARRDDPNQRYFRQLSPDRRAAARTALMGPSPEGLTAEAPTGMTITASTRGCTAQAQRALYGDLAAWFRVKVVTMNLRPVREARVRKDPRYADAVAQWAACMAAAGRPYPTPDASRQAAAGYREALPPAEADAAEAGLAVVEATCATGTPLARVSRTLDRAYGEELRAQHRQDLALRWRLQLGALPKAQRVTGRQAGSGTEGRNPDRDP
ncbi:hypothetical protein AB0953_26560 [Streptomyces sp. NPDC046866]|uniref:hypothetical protein n=1 Tax=Streptomyces sp. NPDC046866 TaxID=3154921 RepID=UPI0034562BE8